MRRTSALRQFSRRFEVHGLIALCLICVIGIATGLMPVRTADADGPVAHQGVLTIIGHGAGSPDDLAIDAQGTLYFSDLANNRVMRLTADGSSQVVSPIIHEPEGIVPLPDGSLIVAEQATNRLFRVDPVRQTMTLAYAVGNQTGNAGIDGLAFDPHTGSLLIPDAPSGRILRLPLDRQPNVPLVIATGFQRPTSVALAADGTLYVCSEFGAGVYRVLRDRPSALVASVATPDDVILDRQGNLIVTSLAGSIWLIHPQTGMKEALVTGLRQPHGITLDRQENLVFSDAGYNQIFRLSLAGADATF